MFLKVIYLKRKNYLNNALQKSETSGLFSCYQKLFGFLEKCQIQNMFLEHLLFTLQNIHSERLQFGKFRKDFKFYLSVCLSIKILVVKKSSLIKILSFFIDVLLTDINYNFNSWFVLLEASWRKCVKPQKLRNRCFNSNLQLHKSNQHEFSPISWCYL